jgi:hypothetical protein
VNLQNKGNIQNAGINLPTSQATSLTAHTKLLQGCTTQARKHSRLIFNQRRSLHKTPSAICMENTFMFLSLCPLCDAYSVKNGQLNGDQIFGFLGS